MFHIFHPVILTRLPDPFCGLQETSSISDFGSISEFGALDATLIPSPPLMKQPRGLILLPDTLLTLPTSSIEVHASHATHILLAAKDTLWHHISSSSSTTSRDDFEDAIWQYECDQFKRIGIKDPLADSFGQDGDEDGRRQSRRTYGERIPLEIPADVNLTTVRSIHVWSGKCPRRATPIHLIERKRED